MDADFEREQALDAALAHHRDGRFEHAESGYRRILKTVPDDPDTLNFLGVLLQDTGDYAGSQTILQHAVRQLPDFAEALTNLARVQQITGQAAAAACSARQAIASDPNLFEAYQQLGRALLDLQDYSAAEATLTHANQLHPGDCDSQVNLGSALLGLGRAFEAEQAFGNALRQHPGQIETVLKIAAAWLGGKCPGQAVAFYKQAVELDPGSALAHAGLAFAHYGRHQPEHCVVASQHALELAPERVELWLLLGRALAHLGQFGAAAAAIRQALALAPGSVRARHDLAMIDRLPADGTNAAALWAALRQASATKDEKIAAGFALGAVLDRAGEYERAFKVYSQANRVVHAERSQTGQAFSPQVLHRATDWLMATFSQALFTRLAGFGDDADQLVFVVGMPRSGTSLVEQIAASHPDVFGAGEQTLVGELVDCLNGGNKLHSPAAWAAGDIRLQAHQVLDRLRASAGGARHIVDKMPDNLFLLGHIAVLFPQARVVLCTRDPRDVCLSAYFQHFGGDMPWCYDPLNCAEQAQEVARLVAHWRRVLPLRMLEFDYEALVADLAGQSRRLIEFLDLPWDPACLAFHCTDRPVMTASYWQVRQPLYATSVARWTHYRREFVGMNFGLLGLTPPPEPEDWACLLADPAQAVTVAKAHHRAGRLDAAEQIYDAVLARHPDDATVVHLRGVLCLNRGQVPTAIGWLLRSRETLPGNAKLSADLARAYHAAKDDTAAAASARVAIEHDPSLSDAWCQLGYALVGQPGCAATKSPDGEAAVAAMREACRLSPHDREAEIGLATVLSIQKQYCESETKWREAGIHFPLDADILLGLSRVLTEQGRHDESLAVILEALECGPASARTLFQLAWVHMRAQNVVRSIETLNQVLQIDKEMIDGWLLLGYGHSMTGDYANAECCYRRVLSLQPDNGEAWVGLVKTRRHLGSDEVVAVSARILDDATASPDDRIAAAFALANVTEAQGDHDASFRAFQTANVMLRASRVASELARPLAELPLLVDSVISMFSRSVVAALSAIGLDSEVPTFIVGLPRSGTTLVEQIAASHPEVCGMGEKGDFLELLGPQTRSMLLTSPDRWDLLALRTACEAFLHKLRQQGRDARRIINKVPTNIHWLGHITTLFPDARIIICRRDPRDVGWSCYAQYFSDDGMSWSDTLEGCAERVRETERLTDHWHQVLPGRFLEIYYEDLVDDVERESRRLIDYLGLAWDPTCLSFHQTERVVMTASHWQVRQPVYTSSVGRWRRYRKHLGPLLDGLQGLVPDDD